ncbi:hypothetical protein FHS31_000716 [Sphingomonas vulcanisoli]|uniref:DUF1993 domain-containing protein n=1 Tax=Sphingomonas vulcanisoli TaxID=1658060 RepID=A0ABX0TNN8_9SPHN|nr:DUF1993 domain-containing protein [Sphingomonas vulcanisoli]NIJ07134.1 hypothetical protein [Sphingomonas vulcanisoli]
MTLSLYEALVPSWLQMIDALIGVVDKAAAFCAERGISEQAMLETRLAEDMLPLDFQIKSIWIHSIVAVERIEAGTFSPDRGPTPTSFAEAKEKLQETRDRIAALPPSALEGLADRDMVFVAGERRVPYTAQNFLLSFSLPNFFFHATTAYAILRGEGVPLGKSDYIGRPRVKA